MRLIAQRILKIINDFGLRYTPNDGQHASTASVINGTGKIANNHFVRAWHRCGKPFDFGQPVHVSIQIEVHSFGSLDARTGFFNIRSPLCVRGSQLLDLTIERTELTIHHQTEYQSCHDRNPNHCHFPVRVRLLFWPPARIQEIDQAVRGDFVGRQQTDQRGESADMIRQG